jgi:hypothetical protein
MHGKIDASVQQGFFDLLGEEAFATLLRQWPILDYVAGGPDNDKLNGLFIRPDRSRQPRTHRARLHQSERTAARTDAPGGCGLRHITSRC